MAYVPEPVEASELEKLATHVRYEFDMLRGAAIALMGLLGTRADQTFIRNLFAESLNVHARNLVAFFRDTLPVRGDDVVAQHYAPTWDPRSDGAVDLVYLDTTLTQSIHKRLAHITAYRTRVPAEDDAQPVAEICWAVCGLMERFLVKLSPQMQAWFDRDGVAPDLSPPVPP